MIMGRSLSSYLTKLHGNNVFLNLVRMNVAHKMTFSILFSRELIRNNNIIIRKNELIIRKLEIIIRNYELIIRKYE